MKAGYLGGAHGPLARRWVRGVLRPLSARSLLVVAVLLGGGPGCGGSTRLEEASTEDVALGADAGSLAADAGAPRQRDETPPQVAILAPTEPCLAGDVRFEVKAADGGAGIGLLSATFASRALSLQSDGGGIYHADFQVDLLSTGQYPLVVVAIDTENNRTEVTGTFGVAREGEYLEGETTEGTAFACGTPPPPPAVDEAAPVVSLIRPTDAYPTYVGDALDVAVSVQDDLGPVVVRVALGGQEAVLEGAFELWTGTLPTAEVPSGPAELEVIATDAAGHETRLRHPVIVDHQPPVVQIRSPLAEAEVIAFTDVTADASDDHGLARLRLFEEGVAAPLGAATAPGPNGQWGLLYRLPCSDLPRDVVFVVQAEDLAGNIGQDDVLVLVTPAGCGP